MHILCLSRTGKANKGIERDAPDIAPLDKGGLVSQIRNENFDEGSSGGVAGDGAPGGQGGNFYTCMEDHTVTYDELMAEVEQRAGTLIQKGVARSQADAILAVFRADPALYERYRAAANTDERPPAWVEKRAEPTDDSPGAQVVRLAKSLAPEDPMGRGVRLVREQQPELWRRYRADYA
jgi:hypothetical protein